MTRAWVCARCGAPIDEVSAKQSVKCPYCGVLNEPGRRRRFGGGEVSSDGVSMERRTVGGLVGVAFVLVLFGVGFAWQASRSADRAARIASTRGATPRPPPVLPTPLAARAVPPKAPEAPPPEPWGELRAVTLDERGDVLAVLGDKLVKVDPKTFTVRWASPFSRDWSSAGNYRIIVPRGDHIAVISDRMAGFFESASGARVNDYRYRSGGILQRVCPAGSTQVLVDVLGSRGIQRFDAATGQRATSGPSCTLREKLGCPGTQRCGWDRDVPSPQHECHYSVHVGATVYRDCEVDDGQDGRVIVREGAGGWEVPSLGRVESYFGVVSDTLIFAGRHGILALDPETGDERWRRRQQRSTAVVAEGSTLYLGDGETLVAVNARTGEELGKLPLREVPGAAELRAGDALQD